MAENIAPTNNMGKVEKQAYFIKRDRIDFNIMERMLPSDVDPFGKASAFIIKFPLS